MVGIIPKYQSEALTRDYYPEMLNFKYPCALVNSKDRCDITVEIRENPRNIDRSVIHPTGNYPIYMKIGKKDRKFSNPIALNNLLNNVYLPVGTYHLEYVSCSCPSFLREMQHKIHSLFGEKVLQMNCCRVHTKKFDVYLRSNQNLSSILKKK